jgi:hypothetical protein
LVGLPLTLPGICTGANEVNEAGTRHRRSSFSLRSSVQNPMSFNRKERKERRDQKAGNTGKEPLAFLSCGRRVLALFSLVLPKFFAVSALFAANSIPAPFPLRSSVPNPMAYDASPAQNPQIIKIQALLWQCGQKA